MVLLRHRFTRRVLALGLIVGLWTVVGEILSALNDEEALLDHD